MKDRQTKIILLLLDIDYIGCFTKTLETLIFLSVKNLTVEDNKNETVQNFTILIAETILTILSPN